MHKSWWDILAEDGIFMDKLYLLEKGGRNRGTSEYEGVFLTTYSGLTHKGVMVDGLLIKDYKDFNPVVIGAKKLTINTDRLKKLNPENGSGDIPLKLSISIQRDKDYYA